MTNCNIQINALSPNGFLLDITKLPELSYFTQTADLPNLTLDVSDMSNPLQRFGVPGEQLEWGQFDMQFLIDEQMDNYVAIYNWMKGLGFPNDHKEFQTFLDENSGSSVNMKSVSDGFLQILGSNNVAVRTFHFIDMFPISLGTLQFQTTNTDVNYLVGNVSFKYSHFKIV